MVENGDRVVINGIELSVVGSWGQGKHKMFRLSDGSEALDLHKAVENGDIKLVTTTKADTPAKSTKTKFGRLPKEDDDIED